MNNNNNERWTQTRLKMFVAENIHRQITGLTMGMLRRVTGRVSGSDHEAVVLDNSYRIDPLTIEFDDERHKRPMLREELDALVLRVGYFGHSIVVGEHPDGFWVQMKYLEPDVQSRDYNPKAEWQGTRKWLVSKWSTPGEVFQTLLKCALTSAEHRVREHFLVDGVRVFGPHLDIDKLIEFVRNNDESHRK